MLNLGEVLQNIQRLRLLLDNCLEISTWDDQDIELSELWLDLSVGGMGFEDDTVAGFDSRSGGGENYFEGFCL